MNKSTIVAATIAFGASLASADPVGTRCRWNDEEIRSMQLLGTQQLGGTPSRTILDATRNSVPVAGATLWSTRMTTQSQF